MPDFLAPAVDCKEGTVPFPGEPPDLGDILPRRGRDPVSRAVDGLLGAADRIKGKVIPIEALALIHSEMGTLVSYSRATLQEAIDVATIYRSVGMSAKIAYEPHPHYCEKPWEVLIQPRDFPFGQAGVDIEDAYSKVWVKGIGEYPISMLKTILEDYDKQWPSFDRETCNIKFNPPWEDSSYASTCPSYL